MKTIAIQQPEHLPWVGFFDKMGKCDEYIFLDNVQFKKRYFENRNKIRTREGWQWITVPVKTKGRYFQRINEVDIENTENWRRNYLKSIEFNYQKSKYFNPYFKNLNEIINRKYALLTELNIGLIEWIRECLNIKTPIKMVSQIRNYTERGSELILAICKDMNADKYISGPDGRNYLDLDRFKRENIKLVFHDFKHPEYSQAYSPFVPFMSTIDFLFNAGRSDKYMDKETLIC
ncbi:MAG: WbqC family protein [Candidatus Omnitrophota bacterium]|nr:MAG: WbqC family protein [Candidatus Omnitrophota bacterium]